MSQAPQISVVIPTLGRVATLRRVLDRLDRQSVGPGDFEVIVSADVAATQLNHLDRLVETGLYGNNRTEAARVAIYDHCKMLINQGTIEMAPRLPGRDVTA